MKRVTEWLLMISGELLITNYLIMREVLSIISVPVAALISMMVEDYLVFKEKRKSQLTSSK